MNNRGYGFAWLAGYRLKCAQTEAIRAGIDHQMACFNAVFYEDAETKAMLDYVMEQLYADPPRFEPFAGVTHPTAAPEVPAIEDPLCGAMTLAYRAPNGDEVFVSKDDNGLPDGDPGAPTPGWAIRPATIACTAEDESHGTYRADWLKGFRYDEGNFVYQTAPMFKHIEFSLVVAPEDKIACIALKKSRSVLDWVRGLFRRR